MATEAQKRAGARYDSANTKQYAIKLNLKTDADIVEWLEQQDSKQGAIKAAIRAYIESGEA